MDVLIGKAKVGILSMGRLVIPWSRIIVYFTTLKFTPSMLTVTNLLCLMFHNHPLKNGVLPQQDINRVILFPPLDGQL